MGTYLRSNFESMLKGVCKSKQAKKNQLPTAVESFLMREEVCLFTKHIYIFVYFILFSLIFTSFFLVERVLWPSTTFFFFFFSSSAYFFLPTNKTKSSFVQLAQCQNWMTKFSMVSRGSSSLHSNMSHHQRLGEFGWVWVDRLLYLRTTGAPE